MNGKSGAFRRPHGDIGKLQGLAGLDGKMGLVLDNPHPFDEDVKEDVKKAPRGEKGHGAYAEHRVEVDTGQGSAG